MVQLQYHQIRQLWQVTFQYRPRIPWISTYLNSRVNVRFSILFCQTGQHVQIKISFPPATKISTQYWEGNGYWLWTYVRTCSLVLLFHSITFEGYLVIFDRLLTNKTFQDLPSFKEVPAASPLSMATDWPLTFFHTIYLPLIAERSLVS